MESVDFGLEFEDMESKFEDNGLEFEEEGLLYNLWIRNWNLRLGDWNSRILHLRWRINTETICIDKKNPVYIDEFVNTEGLFRVWLWWSDFWRKARTSCVKFVKDHNSKICTFFNVAQRLRNFSTTFLKKGKHLNLKCFGACAGKECALWFVKAKHDEKLQNIVWQIL